MPFISRIFIKAGMIYFVLALIAGLLLEINAVSLPALIPLFWHMLMVGWITQIIMGVSIWMFPGRTRQEGFVAQKWGWLTFLFLNTGLLFRIVGEPQLQTSGGEFWNILVAASALLQFAAGVTYLIEMWPRILSKKKRRKQIKKKRNKQ